MRHDGSLTRVFRSAQSDGHTAHSRQPQYVPRPEVRSPVIQKGRIVRCTLQVQPLETTSDGGAA